MSIALQILAAAVAGGLAVYLHFALKPVAYEPIDVYSGGVRIHQVAGRRNMRPRILIAFGGLVACLAFLAGALSGL